MFKRLVLIIINIYKKFISPTLPHSCRYIPSCSTYTYDAVDKYGVIKGIIMGSKRILRCNQYFPGGYDPL